MFPAYLSERSSILQKKVKKLALHRETLKHLSQSSLSNVVGFSGPNGCMSKTYIQLSGNLDCNIETTFC
jgi:hypothetical protein